MFFFLLLGVQRSLQFLHNFRGHSCVRFYILFSITYCPSHSRLTYVILQGSHSVLTRILGFESTFGPLWLLHCQQRFLCTFTGDKIDVVYLSPICIRSSQCILFIRDWQIVTSHILMFIEIHFQKSLSKISAQFSIFILLHLKSVQYDIKFYMRLVNFFTLAP